MPAIRPQIQGFGVNTAAGRGGQILRVTNTNDTGAGSFREAATTAGARQIVFETSGIINLTSAHVNIINGSVSIFGSTAPSPGITIRGPGTVILNAPDIFVSHVGFRVGVDDIPFGVVRDSLSLNDGINGLVVDHCSLSWSTDELVGMASDSGGNAAFWRCILADPMNRSIRGPSDTPHGLAFLHNDNIPAVSVIQCFYANCLARVPLSPGPTGGTAGILIANNICYNKANSGLWSPTNSGIVLLSIVGNRFEDGAALNGVPDGKPANEWIRPGAASAGSKGYFMDNTLDKIVVGQWVEPLYGEEGFGPRRDDTLPTWWPASFIALLNADVDDVVLPHAGARPLPGKRVAIDVRVINNYINGTGPEQLPDIATGHPDWSEVPATENTEAFDEGPDPNGASPTRPGYTKIEDIIENMALALEPPAPISGIMPQGRGVAGLS